jgi:hypothetical protein
MSHPTKTDTAESCRISLGETEYTTQPHAHSTLEAGSGTDICESVLRGSIMRNIVVVLVLATISIFALAQLLGSGINILPRKPMNVVITDEGATAIPASIACGGQLTGVATWCEIHNSGGDGWVRVVASVGCGSEWSESKRVHAGRGESVRVEFHLCLPCGLHEYYYDFQTEIEEAD